MSNDQNQGGQAPRLKGVSIRRSRGRRHALIGSTCFCAAIIVLAATANITLPWLSDVISKKQIQSADAQEARIGTIELQTGQDQCDLLKFDNDTGRTINDAVRCHSDVILDGRGAPMPMGTVHRLDSISKSFLGGGH